MNDRDELISVSEAARRRKVHRQTIYREMAKGLITTVEVPTTTRMIRASDLASLLKAELQEKKAAVAA